MTDFQPIGEEALEMLSAHPRFESITGADGFQRAHRQISGLSEKIPTRAAEILSTA